MNYEGEQMYEPKEFVLIPRELLTPIIEAANQTWRGLRTGTVAVNGDSETRRELTRLYFELWGILWEIKHKTERKNANPS